MIPVAASAIEVLDANPGKDLRDHYSITCDGEYLPECYDFNEAKGWADCWSLNEAGGVYRDGNDIAHHRVVGVIRLEAHTPELRTWFEERFPASKREVSL